jgi:hypothetical protein
MEFTSTLYDIVILDTSELTETHFIESSKSHAASTKELFPLVQEDRSRNSRNFLDMTSNDIALTGLQHRNKEQGNRSQVILQPLLLKSL